MLNGEKSIQQMMNGKVWIRENYLMNSWISYSKKTKTCPFITYVGGQEADRKEVKVRVNGKFKPWDDKITYPPYMKDFRKTTMVKYIDDSTWHVVATRVAATVDLKMKDLDREVDTLCVCVPAGATERPSRCCVLCGEDI